MAKIDVSTLTYAELKALVASATDQLTNRRSAELEKLVQGFLTQLDKSGFKIAEASAMLGLGKVRKVRKGTGKASNGTAKPRKSSAGGVVAPKYQKGAETWAGRGHKPAWVKEHLAAGGALDDLLINRA